MIPWILTAVVSLNGQNLSQTPVEVFETQAACNVVADVYQREHSAFTYVCLAWTPERAVTVVHVKVPAVTEPFWLGVAAGEGLPQ
jgi:hypothetical protein